MLEGETSVIADLEDLKEVLSITQNFDGIPKFKAEFLMIYFILVLQKRQNPIPIIKQG